MTNANEGRTDEYAGDQTIPLVPDAGYAQPALQPLPEVTLVDAVGTGDPWASGPGLGQASTERTQPLPTTPPSGTTSWTAAGGSSATPSQAPQPTAVLGYASPAEYSRSTAASSWTPAPAPAPAPAPVRPPANSYTQPPYAEVYPEPNGPAAGIGNQGFPTYAASGYAGQAWPAVVDPVAYDYGYSRMASGPHPNAAISMVLGILGLTVFTPLAPFAWYLAAKGRREMTHDPGRWQPSGMLTAGLVMGIIGTLLMAFVLVVVLFVLAIMASAG